MSHFSVNTAIVRVKSSSAYKSQDVSDFEIDGDISFSFLYHMQWCSWLRSNSLVSGNLATHPCWDRKRRRARRTTLHMGSLEGVFCFASQDMPQKNMEGKCADFRTLVLDIWFQQDWDSTEEFHSLPGDVILLDLGHTAVAMCVLLLWTFHWPALNDRVTHSTESIRKIQAKGMLRKEEMVDKWLPSLPRALFLITDLSRQPRSRKIKREIYKLLFPHLVNLLCSVRFATQGISQLRKDQ